MGSSTIPKKRSTRRVIRKAMGKRCSPDGKWAMCLAVETGFNESASEEEKDLQEVEAVSFLGLFVVVGDVLPFFGGGC